MSGTLSRRQRQIALTTALVGLVVVVCVVLPFLLIDTDSKSQSRNQRLDGITDRLARNLPPDHPRTKFKEAAADFGVNAKHSAGHRSSLIPEDMGPGCGLEDLDQDGDLDLFLVGFAGLVGKGDSHTATPPKSGETHKLFRNDDGHFVDVTDKSNLAAADYGLGVAFGDVDGDGLLDIYVACYGKNRLFRNLGGLQFEDITDKAQVGDRGFGCGAAFADPDRDGDLDLYVCNYLAFSWDGSAPEASPWGSYSLPSTLNPSSFPPASNLYYVNRGDGTFDEKSKAFGIHDPEGKSLGATFADFNEDGWPDLYVLNDVSKNAYFENRKDGTFEDRSLASLSADYRGAMGNAVADMDADGDLDLFITHWMAQENGAYSNFWRQPGEDASANPERGLVFSDVADLIGLGSSGLNFVGWGTAFWDYDLDGFADLIVVNGSTMPSKHDPRILEPQRAQLFWQKPHAGYFEVGSAAGECWSEKWNARGLVEGDLDGDGDLDCVVTSNYGPVRILRNDGPTGHHLIVRLRQKRGNRFAIGARVSVTVGDHTMVREVGAGTSYLSHRPLQLTFGLGAKTHVDRVVINWPDGTTSTLKDLKADQILTVHPGKGK